MLSNKELIPIDSHIEVGNLMVGDASHNQSSFPFSMDRVTTVLQLIEAFIGLPLNVMMAAIIISWRRLHSSRNILWLGSAFSNLFILITNIIKFYAFHWQDVPSCKLYVFLVGIPYASLLMNLLLALIDRSICVTRPSWYRRRVKISWILLVQLSCFLLICFIVKSPYIFGLLSLQCTFNQRVGQIVTSTTLTLFILCILGQVTLYWRVKYYLTVKDSNSSTRSNNDIPLQVMNGTDTVVANCDDGGGETNNTNQRNFASTAAASNSRNNESYFVQIGSEMVSRLELEATHSVIAGVFSLVVFATPTIIVSSLLFVGCSRISDASLRSECSAYYSKVLGYTTELIQFHSIYSPIFYGIKSKDCFSAFHQIWSHRPRSFLHHQRPAAINGLN